MGIKDKFFVLLFVSDLTKILIKIIMAKAVGRLPPWPFP